MANTLSKVSNTQNAKERYRRDLKRYRKFSRSLGNIKDNAGGILYEQLDSLSSTITDLKDKAAILVEIVLQI